jgi:hypothetical protein
MGAPVCEARFPRTAASEGTKVLDPKSICFLCIQCSIFEQWAHPPELIYQACCRRGAFVLRLEGCWAVGSLLGSIQSIDANTHLSINETIVANATASDANR